MKNKSILCPKPSDHHANNGKYLKKTLLIVGEDCVYAFCQKHGWLKIEFLKFGKKIDFSDSSVKITDAPDFIPTLDAVTVSSGRFKKKCRQ
jgi:hypothetical protein